MASSDNIKKIDTREITSAEAVLAELSALNTQLPGTRLEKLLTFNQAYYVVSRVIADASNDNYFAYPEFIEAFNVRFAHYYFKAVNDLAAGDEVVPAWAKAIEPATKERWPAFISLLMGANAHINYDLPLALLDTMNQARQKELLKDLSKIDHLLMQGGRQILDTFDEPNKLLDFIKRHGQFLYFRPVMYMILWWRIIAWRNYKRLRRGRLDRNSLAARSTKIANCLAWLGNRLS